MSSKKKKQIFISSPVCADKNSYFKSKIKTWSHYLKNLNQAVFVTKPNQTVSIKHKTEVTQMTVKVMFKSPEFSSSVLPSLFTLPLFCQ